MTAERVSEGTVSLSGLRACALVAGGAPDRLLRKLAAAVRSGSPAHALAAALELSDALPSVAAYAVDGPVVHLFATGTGSAVGIDATGTRHRATAAAGSGQGVGGLVEVVLSGGRDAAVHSVHYLDAATAIVPLPDPRGSAGTQPFAESEPDLEPDPRVATPLARVDKTMTGQYDFGHLISGTGHERVEAAAVRADEPENEEDLESGVGWEDPLALAPAPLASGVEVPSAGWSPPSLLGGAPRAPGTTFPPELSSSSGPPVQAVACPTGHLSHPAAPVCRVCGSPIIDRNVAWVPRPSLGRLIFDNGTVVELDRSLVIGRRPTDGGRSGNYGLVTVDDPQSSISRSHAEVVIADWQILVNDLGSTNGTVVESPGEEPVRLRPDVAHVVGPGVRVVLGGSITFEIAQSRD